MLNEYVIQVPFPCEAGILWKMNEGGPDKIMSSWQVHESDRSLSGTCHVEVRPNLLSYKVFF